MHIQNCAYTKGTREDAEQVTQLQSRVRGMRASAQACERANETLRTNTGTRLKTSKHEKLGRFFQGVKVCSCREFCQKG